MIGRIMRYLRQWITGDSPPPTAPPPDVQAHIAADSRLRHDNAESINHAVMATQALEDALKKYHRLRIRRLNEGDNDAN